MPFTQMSLRRGKSDAYRKALMRGIYEAMRETFNVPEEDRFMTVGEYDEAQFEFGPDYLGIHRTDDLVIIQITANDTRTVDQKKALYAAMVRKLANDPGVSPGNVLVNLVEVKKENWSFGDGLAQYA
jgi:4-oxalocrotonate tautomerase